MTAEPGWRQRYEPIGLLLFCGATLAVIINLFKAGGQLGLTSSQIAFGSSLGAGLILFLWSLPGGGVPVNWRHLRAYIALGAISYGVPTALGALIAFQVGAGYSSVMTALSPIVTYALACVFGIATLAARKSIGLALGLVGTMILVAPGLSDPGGTIFGWMALGLVIPLALASGNILRTLMVPPETPSRLIAAGVLLTAACLLAPLALTGPLAAFGNFQALGILAACAAISSIFNVALFRLQKVAGPVMLSQIGYVAAAFGIGIAALTFGEVPTIGMIVAVALIIVGIRFVSATPARVAAPAPLR